jgi:NitT/TauT family transport system substrate-binding protein
MVLQGQSWALPRYRRRWLWLFAALYVLAALVAAPARGAADDSISVGALRFTSSGPLFLARARGHFAAERLDVRIRFFDAAPNVALAVASGELTFGSAALTAAFFNLAGEGKLMVIAGQAREERGYPGNLVLVTKRAHDAGLTRLEDLFSQPFGLTQYGSPSHYQLGQLAAAHSVPLSAVPIRAFQSLPNLVAAMKGDRVTWAIVAPPVAQDLVDSGHAVSFGRYSDSASFQFGAIFTRREMLEARSDVVRRFLRAYLKGVDDYASLNAGARGGGAAVPGRVRETAELVASYVYPDQTPEQGARKVIESAFFVDPRGGVDADDVARQITWYFEQRLIRRRIETSDFVRLDFIGLSPGTGE